MTVVDWDRIGREAAAAIDVLKSAAAAVKTPEQPQRTAICAIFHNAARMHAAEQGWPPSRWFYATTTSLRGWGGPVLCLDGCGNRRDAETVHHQIRFIRSMYGPRDPEPSDANTAVALVKHGIVAPADIPPWDDGDARVTP